MRSRTVWAWLAWAISGSLAAATPALSAEFTVEDIEACTPRSSVNDPEFDSASGQLIFIDGKGQLKVLAMGPTALPPTTDCAGTVIDPRAVIITRSYVGIPNGPEWARSQRGLEVLYTRRTDTGSETLARAWNDGQQWRTETLADGAGRGSGLASLDDADPQPRYLYAKLVGNKTAVPAWRDADNAAGEQTFRGTFPSRWVPGQRAITTSRQASGGGLQAFRYWIDAGSYEQLTFGPGDKREVNLWSAPEFGGDEVFATVVDFCCLKIFRRQGADWVEIQNIDARTIPGRSRLWSPEPLVHQGRSYVAFMVANAETDPVQTTDIWIAAIDPAQPLMRQVSQTTVDAVRIEPEWFVSSHGVFVFYSQYDSLARPALRRTATGLP